MKKLLVAVVAVVAVSFASCGNNTEKNDVDSTFCDTVCNEEAQVDSTSADVDSIGTDSTDVEPDSIPAE